jgi:hypothetical protein
VSADSALIDRIVQEVLTQLGRDGVRADAKPPVATAVIPAVDAGVQISERIVTADVLNERVNGSRVVVVGPKALVTPAAWDLIRERDLTLRRSDAKPQVSDAGRATPSDKKPAAVVQRPLLFVIRNTDAVERLWSDLQATWRRELLGCPDDAAKLAISAIARGETNAAVILAEQSHRAACLANRSDAVKAVAVRDAADVPVVRKQLRANVWCVDPTGRSWFELRNLMKAINK